MINETPAAAAVFVPSVVYACIRDACPLSLVASDPQLCKGLLKEHSLGDEGVAILANEELSGRTALHRFPPVLLDWQRLGLWFQSHAVRIFRGEPCTPNSTREDRQE